MVRYFGAEKPLADITEGDADEFRLTQWPKLFQNLRSTRDGVS